MGTLDRNDHGSSNDCSCHDCGSSNDSDCNNSKCNDSSCSHHHLKHDHYGGFFREHNCQHKREQALDRERYQWCHHHKHVSYHRCVHSCVEHISFSDSSCNDSCCNDRSCNDSKCNNSICNDHSRTHCGSNPDYPMQPPSFGARETDVLLHQRVSNHSSPTTAVIRYMLQDQALDGA